MTDKETRGLFQGETTSFSLGDVQHFEKHWFVGDDRARVPYRGIQIITCHTKWNFEHDIWENNIYLSRDEAEKFIKQWSDEHEQNPSAINIIFDSGEDVRTITDSIFDDPGALEDCLNRCRKLIGAKKALLDAVREVRDEGYAANALWVIKALTRIIDEHECPLITDIPASVTKPVGTGSGTKAVTMTPDE